jgi:hypothetical protein
MAELLVQGLLIEFPVFGLTDQPTTCPKCGCRTSFYELDFGTSGSDLYRELHTCNNSDCQIMFIAEEDEDDERDQSTHA